jgi:hypothetical protein
MDVCVEGGVGNCGAMGDTTTFRVQPCAEQNAVEERMGIRTPAPSLAKLLWVS